MARVTGLEPATSGVTGRHSNRLSYTRALCRLTAASEVIRNSFEERVARVTGLEPATSGVTGRHSNRLSYTRISLPEHFDLLEIVSMFRPRRPRLLG